MKLLETKKQLNLENIRNSCAFELQRFIKMRGSIDSSGKIHLPLMTISDKNSALVIKKIGVANDLIKRIEASNSLKGLYDTLQNEPSLSLGDDLDAVIGKCLVIVGLSKIQDQSSPV